MSDLAITERLYIVEEEKKEQAHGGNNDGPSSQEMMRKERWEFSLHIAEADLYNYICPVIFEWEWPEMNVRLQKMNGCFLQQKKKDGLL